MRRQLVTERLGRPTETAPHVRVESRSAKAKVGKEFAQLHAEQEAFSLEPTDDATPDAYFTHARQVERIELRNFRIIEELDLAIDPEAAALLEPRPDARRQAARPLVDAPRRERPRQEHGAPGRLPGAARREDPRGPRARRVGLRAQRRAARVGQGAPERDAGADRADRPQGLAQLRGRRLAQGAAARLRGHAPAAHLQAPGGEVHDAGARARREPVRPVHADRRLDGLAARLERRAIRRGGARPAPAAPARRRRAPRPRPPQRAGRGRGQGSARPARGAVAPAISR